MSNPNREFDKTHLSIDTAEERILIHRDYIAHCNRWSHVIKHLYGKKRYQTAKILDIGCGKEMPLAKALYSNKMSGAVYCGVDLNEIIIPEMLRKAMDNGKLEIHTLSRTSACDLTPQDLQFRPNVITNFETFEHMNPEAARKSLERCYRCLGTDGYMFFSTPCWNGKAAANHINETTFEAMGHILQKVGFVVYDVFGTFASITDYKDQLCEWGLDRAFDRLRTYYDTNMLSTLLAPLFPEYARNALWVLKKTGVGRHFPEPIARWSQHNDWEKLRG